ncbi:MAG: hypothetical protein GFH27_549305n3 [Chloroflexi bacterium AL-W]|nr:hypothetical protein [Chloroflexi bacterium AL-N1]NOK69249.1 hypothetical protein [Chloroflexi bacterium AL-N10]NOK76310.1 hypothetical protein [Chloroflexi bacterium AL-N5]NOK83427.1 hypothetical protein [Chloroflexi bacterium AL-W]NOK91087.1 hypothetical protein [Chloroflexi bacterium AL-N15]
MRVLMAQGRLQQTADGQTFCKYCHDEALRIAQVRGLRNAMLDDGTTGKFNPSYQRYGADAHTNHYAVRNPDGTITDITILLNIAAYSTGRGDIEASQKSSQG